MAGKCFCGHEFYRHRQNCLGTIKACCDCPAYRPAPTDPPSMPMVQPSEDCPKCGHRKYHCEKYGCGGEDAGMVEAARAWIQHQHAAGDLWVINLEDMAAFAAAQTASLAARVDSLSSKLKMLVTAVEAMDEDPEVFDDRLGCLREAMAQAQAALAAADSGETK